MLTFRTIHDAEQAGYKRASEGVVRDCGDYAVIIRDANPAGALGPHGYDYIITGKINGQYDVTKCDKLPNFPVAVRSVTVKFTEETNKAGSHGAYLPMFQPGDVEYAIQEIQQWWQNQSFTPADWK